MTTSWSYSTSTKRYRDDASGRFLSEKNVIGYRDKIVDEATKLTAALAKAVSDGTITPSDFAAELRKTIKTVYVAHYELGRGGKNALSASDKGIIGRALRDQYRYLDRFQRDIEAAIKGKEASAEQIATRASMYAENGIAMYERAQAAAHKLFPPILAPRHPHCKCWWSYGEDEKGPFAVWKLGDRPCPECGGIEAKYGSASPYRKEAA